VTLRKTCQLVSSGKLSMSGHSQTESARFSSEILKEAEAQTFPNGVRNVACAVEQLRHCGLVERKSVRACRRDPVDNRVVHAVSPSLQ
jgi:hypothetical protein